jgi:hypothetical protein
MKDGTLIAVKKDVVTLRVFGPEDPETGERLGNKIKDKGSRIGHKRTINVTADLRPYLLAVLASHPHRGNPKAPLWVMADGEPATEYHHAFEKVLEELGMERDEEGNNLVLGSLRHSFITEKLWEMGKPGSKATLPMIEAYCDTSQKEIKLHYNHILNRSPQPASRAASNSQEISRNVGALLGGPTGSESASLAPGPASSLPSSSIISSREPTSSMIRLTSPTSSPIRPTIAHDPPSSPS